MSKVKDLMNFEFWQKFGKALMGVIAAMPAAGLMISIGNSLPIIAPETAWLQTLAGFISAIGWAIIGNLHLLFAVSIGGSWAKDRAGGAFAATIAFVLLNRLTGAIFGVSNDMLLDPSATTSTLFGQTIPVNTYFISVLEAPALNMGVFVGIIAGFLGAAAYNRYYNYRKLPEVLSFFNGKRFVPFVVIAWSVVAAIILAIIWPVIQSGINAFGIWLAQSKDNAPFIAPFLFGFLERLLLPFGLHHMLTVPVNYTSVGGVYTIMTGAQAGQIVEGQDPLWFAWVTDLVNLRQAGDTAAYNQLLESVVPARFKVGQMIGSSGTLMGLAYAMYRNVDSDKKQAYKGMFLSTALAVFLTGVTEPLEFMFMFIAMPLYVVYAIIQGLSFGIADVFNLRVHSFGNLEMLTRTPLAISAGLTQDVINYIIACIVFGVIAYFVANYMIQRFEYATPGRLGNYEIQNTSDDVANSSSMQTADGSQIDLEIVQIINMLGGKDNIQDVDACMTRLRVTVNDPEKVAKADTWKKAGAMSMVVKGQGIQAVYGPKADVLKSDIQDALDSGVAIPEASIEDLQAEEETDAVAEAKGKWLEETLVAVSDGRVMPISDVPDEVFRSKVMGDGYGLDPSNGQIYSPVKGRITSIFPAKHAINIKTDTGAGILIHMGIDTVELEGKPFDIWVSEGDLVDIGDSLAEMNIAQVKEAGKSPIIMVVALSDEAVGELTLIKSGQVQANDELGTLSVQFNEEA